MFRAASLLLINKVDLLPHVDFNIPRVAANAAAVNPDMPVPRLSASSEEGMQSGRDWLRREAKAAGEAASSPQVRHADHVVRESVQA